MIYAVRVTSGRENIVVELINSSIVKKKLNIKSISYPAEIKGYIFIEGELEEITKALQGVMHIKGIIQKPISINEIEHFFKKKESTITFNIGDIVEIIGGPFKGEKGKIERIDQIKKEVTVELLEASIPIPVTISVELVKLVKRG